MGLVEQEIFELRNLAAQVLEGLDAKKVNLLMNIYNQTSKRVNQFVAIQNLSTKNKKAYDRIVKANIISENIAIDVISNSQEKFKCPAKGDLLVDRETCLDYSGCAHNIDNCQNCPHFGITRKQIFSE
jgi:methyl coenzyme M reductase beta subunit